MPARIVINAQTGGGEQVSVDVVQWNPVTGVIEHQTEEEMLQFADRYMQVVDDRKAEMHRRMLEGYGLRQYCSPEEWHKISCVLDIIAGHIDAETVVRRWQSAIEENTELAAGRLHAQNTCYSERLPEPGEDWSYEA